MSPLRTWTMTLLFGAGCSGGGTSGASAPALPQPPPASAPADAPVLPGKGEACAPGDGCGPSLTCLHYPTTLGPRSSCERRCDATTPCPDGGSCRGVVDEGPSNVCQ